MNKLVYLHELDSVRKSKEEILRGQQAMYEEIVLNGNTVVLTFNQFADSKTFLCGLNDKKQGEHIVELFKRGCLKLSNYKDTYRGEEIRTASQYMQNAIKKNIEKDGSDSAFIFSGISIDINEKELLKAMHTALETCNPSYMDVVKDDDNVERIKAIKKYITILLNLSIEERANNPIKDVSEIRSFIEFMHRAYNSLEKQGLYMDAVRRLKDVETKMNESNINSRSPWLLELEKNENENCEDVPDDLYLAKAIVNLVYNYTVEDSIKNISKHYDDEEPKSFEYDFVNRLVLFWTEFEDGKHESLKKGFKSEEKMELDFPKWDTAVRVTKENELFTIKKKDKEKDKKVKDKQNIIVDEYESGYEKNKKKWRRKIRRNILLQAIAAIIYIVAMLTFDKLTGTIEECVRAAIGLLGLNMGVIATYISNFLIFTVILGAITSFVSTCINLPDILESVKDILYSLKDVIVIKRAKRGVSYVRVCKEQSEGE